MKSILMLLCLSLPVSARISETLEQCISRYGDATPQKSTKPDETDYSFKKAGLTILVTFWKGAAHRIGFIKSETDVLGTAAKMTETEQTALKEANGGGLAWVKSSGNFGKQGWMTDDQKRYATYDAFKHYFVVTTFEFAMKTGAEAQAAEKKKLEGF
jgi:hypothetical protein